MMDEIRTFDQARAALARHGVVVEKSDQPKLWQVGHEHLDKGGVIAKARAVASVGATSAAPAAPREAYRIELTDLDAVFVDQLRTAGWMWQHAKRARNGWHHVVRNTAGDQRLLLRSRLEALLGAPPNQAATQSPPRTSLGDSSGAPPQPMATTIRLAQIRTDGGTQARAGLSTATVNDYREAISHAGAVPFPSIVVMYDGADYWLADGFHRVAAVRAWADQHTPDGARQATIAAEVRQGTRRDAVLYACGANATHGLQRTPSDKRRAVETLLRDPEWRQWSDREIGRRCAVDHKTVARVRQEVEGDWGIPQSAVRQGADGRAINIAPIAAANTARAQAVEPQREPQREPATPVLVAARSSSLPTVQEVDQPPTSPELDPPAPASAPPIWEQRRHPPIVPHVLHFDEQRHPYRLPDPQRLPVLYGTPTTVRVMLAGQSQTKQQTQVWCVPDDAAWQRLVHIHQAFQAALDALAGALRTLGSYPKRLAEAGGMQQAPNPLTPTVIFAQDPDDAGGWWSQLGRVPLIRRYTVAQHTPQMLRLVESMATICAQRDHFVCPTDADWERIQAAHRAAVAAGEAFSRLLAELGTYDRALHDGRYQREQPTPVALAPAPQPAETAPAHPAAITVAWKDAARQAEAALSNSYQHDDRAAARAAALQLLAALAEPHELVLPPFPADDRAALIAEIRDWMEALDEHTPQIGRFLRAVAHGIL